MIMSIQKTIDLGGSSVTLTFNKFAPQANGSVMATQGNAMVLATATCGGRDDSKDYFPLSVDFVHKLYAGAQIKGGKWSKRDNGGPDADILDSRIIDRSIRPLFPSDFKYETQVIATLMSADKSVDNIVLGFLATAVALAVSDIPFNGPVSAVRIARNSDKKLIANPNAQALLESDLDLLVCTGPAGVNMIEADGKIIDNATMFSAIELAVKTSEDINKQIAVIAKEIGKTKLNYVSSAISPELEKEIQKKLSKDIAKFLEGGTDGAHKKAEEELFKKGIEIFTAEIEAGTYTKFQVDSAISTTLEAQFKAKVLSGWRYDGRKADQIRPLSLELGVLPGTHGSAFFQRGLTQAVTNVTLATLEEQLYTQNSQGEATKRYMHFYSAMPFSTGEVGRTGRPGRREIGHGALAEKALLAVLPSIDQFPYTLVLNSEVLSQNGSSSMASTCGSTMALMDAGVPISAHVAGVSTGMISSSDEKYTLLTDIAGIEDHFGDMDFKITGTRKGITAIQLDIKRAGLTLKMIQETLTRSHDVRQIILDLMEKTLASPRPQLAPHAPKIVMIQLPEDKIGGVIGKGGETIKALMERFEVGIDINDEGMCSISGTNQAKLDECKKAISGMIKDIEIGEEYLATVAEIRDFGAFMELLPEKQALLHISEMAQGFVKDVNSLVKIGDQIKVKVSGFNDEGKIKLVAPEFKAAHKGEERGSPMGQARSDARSFGERHSSASAIASPPRSVSPPVSAPTSSGPTFANFNPAFANRHPDRPRAPSSSRASFVKKDEQK